MKAILKYTILSICLCLSNACDLRAQGIITTIAGTGITQYIGDGYPADSFSLAAPKGIYVDQNGKVYVADFADSRIRTIYNDTLKTICGGDTLAGDSGDGGLADTAGLRNPDGVWLDTAGNIYITEWYDDLLRKINAHTGIITTICGITGGGFGGDGGPATLAKLSSPAGACVDIAGNIYIADKQNQRIRKINATTGDISTIAGTGVNGYGGDNGPATAAILSYPSSVSNDSVGNIYIADYGNHVIRRVDASTGLITTVAGNATQGYSGDRGLAVNAELNNPNGVFAGKCGYMYISDYGNDVIRMVTPGGIIYTIAGNGEYGYTGDGGPSLNATFRGLAAVCADDTGNVYISDGLNSVIRKVTPIDTLTLGTKSLIQSSFNIYPNPSTGKFTIVPEVQSNATILVTNTLGQCVYSTSSNASQTNVDLSVCPGLYFVYYISDNGTLVKKIVIQ